VERNLDAKSFFLGINLLMSSIYELPYRDYTKFFLILTNRSGLVISLLASMRIRSSWILLLEHQMVDIK
jgi:hypothetical protein